MSAARPPTEPVLEERLQRFGRAAVRAVSARRRRRPARRPLVRRRARAASSRCATSCPTGPRGSWSARCCCPRCSRRSTRSSAPAAGASRSGRGSPGWRSPPCRCRWRGCGCGCSGRSARSTRPTARSLPERFPLERGGIIALVSAAIAAALACWLARFAARAWGRRARREAATENGRRGASGARRRRPRGRDRRVAVRPGGARVGDQSRTPPACSCRPRTCGCSPPRATGACGPRSPR